MRARFDAIIADLTFALRQLRRSPVLAIAAILCFALGIGVNSAIFSIVNGVLIRPCPIGTPIASWSSTKDCRR